MTHTLRVYSYCPYAPKEPGNRHKHAVAFLRAFKNGRGYRFTAWDRDFAQVVQIIVDRARECPAFGAPCIVVPVPRSGSSRKSFDPRASDLPCLPLARALADAIPGVQVAELLTRIREVPRASDTDGRVSVQTHLESLAVDLPRSLVGKRLVLLDDLLTKGTQLMACCLALQNAGHHGEIEAFCVAQTVAPSATPEQLEPYLIHHVRWRKGQKLASRDDRQQWRPRTVSSSG